MGATLANGGVNPITGVRALASDYVGDVLSVMATCGMYDASGDWLYQTGMPAKSGVGGGVLAVQPGRLAIAVFSPRLDAQGNSARGVAVCRAIAEDLRLHVLDGSDRAMSPVRRSLTRRMVASKKRRSEAASEHLKRVGDRVRLYHLHGVLVFASVEEIIRRMLERSEESDLFILNFKLVQGINLPSLRLLAQAQSAFHQEGKRLLFTEASVWWQSLIDLQADSTSFFADDDFALEFAENTLLAEWQTSTEQNGAHGLSDCKLFKGFSAEDLLQVEQVLVSRTYYQGQTMVAVGQSSDELFVIMSGEAMVSAPTESGLTRLDVFSVGCTFGEVAFIDRSPRSANVTALGLVECRILTRMAFEELAESAPQLRYKIMERIAFGLAGTVRQINRDLALLK
jgi:glutaminase